MHPKFPEKSPFDPKRYDYYTYPEFEFDTTKSESNKAKHGIDFEEAQRLWRDDNRSVIPGRSNREFREGIIARTGPDFWTAIYTLRHGKVRLISVRRSRHEEKEFYRDIDRSAEDRDGGGIRPSL